MSDEDLWSRLHDAFLERIDVDFTRGIITIRLRLPTEAEAARIPLAGAAGKPSPVPGPVQITVEGFRDFVCPHREPWGLHRFTCVNHVTRSSEAGDLAVLRIQTIGGDEIEIHGGRMAMRRP